MEEESDVFYDEGKNFLEEVKAVIFEAKKRNKKVVFASENLVIASLEDEGHTIYEVYDRDNHGFVKKLVYIGDKAIKASYLLNLIHRQELKLDPYTEKHY